MRIGILFGVLALMCSTGNAQIMDELSRYKYVSVETLINNKKNIRDEFGVSSYTRFKLINMGYEVVDEEQINWPASALENPCLHLYCDLNDRTRYLGKNKVDIALVNCKGDTVYFGRGSGYDEVSEGQAYKNAIDMAFRPLKNYEHSYDASIALKPDLPTVEIKEFDKSRYHVYYDSATLDPVEGIYTIEGAKYNFEIAFRKDGERYPGTILETDHPNWEAGEVRSYAQESLLEGIYNITWYNNLKEKLETIGKVDDSGNIVIEVQENEERRTVKLIRTYPQN